MKRDVTLRAEYAKGLWQNNPVLKQALGLCPALAVTVTALNGLAMGLATTFVLVFSSLIVSLIRRWIPHQVRIAAHIVIIATFVTIVDLVMKARFPELSAALGPYIPLIVVNCLILGRQEMFASKNEPHRAVLDGLGAGSGFLVVLFLLGGARELLGNGAFLGVRLMPRAFEPWVIMVLPGGAFLTLGVMMAAANAYSQYRQRAGLRARQEMARGQELVRGTEGEEAAI
jgi:Na+-translocating ferredoxin:NAD+ oxidoreductase subunit E